MRRVLVMGLLAIALLGASCSSSSGISTTQSPTAIEAATSQLRSTEPTPAEPAPTEIPATEMPAAEIPATETEAVPDVEDAPPAAQDTSVVASIEESIEGKPGGVVIAYRNGAERDSFAVGAADADGRLLGLADPMRVGSLSKPFVATMVLQMVEEGSVDLDAQITTYIETPVGGEATIRQLLGHRSGVANYTDNREFVFSTFIDLSQTVTPEQVLDAVVEQRSFPPGSSFSYSNTNYTLLGLLVEAVDGRDLQSSLAARIAEPLGLEHTVFGLSAFEADGVGGWAAGLLDGDPAAEYTSIATGAWAAGALVSTVDDLMVFLDALVAGELVASPLLDEMIDTSGPGGYGLGIAATSVPSSGSIGHNGAIPGFLSYVSINPDTGDAIVVLTNSDRLDPRSLARTVAANW